MAPRADRASTPTRLASLLPDRVLVGLIGRAHRRFEPELRALDAYLPVRRRTALDVGAWYGPWAVALARRFEQVVTIEANPAVADRLAGALPANVRLERFAASDRTGSAILEAPEALGAEGVGRLTTEPTTAGHRAVEVPTRTVDALGLDDVDLMKVDVEGHELAALTGATATIERCRPVLVVELEERLAPVAPVLALLDGWGYRPHVVRAGTLVPLDPDDPIGATPPPRSYLATVLHPDPNAPPNNIVFVP